MAADTELENFMMEMEQSATLLVRQNHQRRVKQALQSEVLPLPL